MGQLDGKVAVVTGGCSGIGLGTVELFVKEGCQVVVADVQDEKGAALEARFGDVVTYVSCDVTDEAQIQAAIARADSAFGGLDILFNNAGLSDQMWRIADLDGEAWDRTFALTVRAPALAIKHAAPRLAARGGGSIINTSSVAALQAGYGPIAYSSAKAALLHLTRITAGELARQKIRVNAICPGLIATSIFGASFGLARPVADQLAARVAAAGPRMQPIAKAGLPEDVAQAVLYLASDASTFVTGTHLVIDGGLTTGPRSSWEGESSGAFTSLMTSS